MPEGRARGGPLDNVKVAAGYDWTGAITGSPDGRYVWSSIAGTWVWKSRVTKKLDHVKPLKTAKTAKQKESRI